jgi:hypothetical protein
MSIHLAQGAEQMHKPDLKKPRQWPGQEGLEKDTATN